MTSFTEGDGAVQGERRMLRVATWNLWWRFGNWQRREPAIRQALAELDADVVGLQEVWARGGTGQADELADHLGYHHAWASSPRPGRFQDRLPGSEDIAVANAILSRWPLDAVASTEVSDAADPSDGRSALFARVATPEGPLTFCSTQLSSTVAGGSRIRTGQATRLTDWLSDQHTATEHTLVLVGDLNADPDSDEMRRLGGYKTDPLPSGMVFVDAWRYRDDFDPGYTWRRDNPHVLATREPWARIDYILISPGTSGLPAVDDVGLFGHEPIDGIHPSDHAGVFADLRLPQQTTR
jgi:endonuclease/exonuclease/phosphatase family metal-dependent hydrolase